MNRMRLILLAAALVAGLLAAYLSSGLLRRPATTPAPVVQKTVTKDVLIAGRDLATGDRFGSTGMQWRPWPADAVLSSMITREAMPDALDKLREARARTALVAGEPLATAKIIQPGEGGFMSSILTEGMRAVTIPISELSGVSGFILPNDRVDVIFTRIITDPNGNKTTASEAVLTNVKVLAINQTLGGGTDGAAIPDSRAAVLELDPKQTEVLAKISTGGQLSLALRSLEDTGDGKPQLADAYRNPSRTATGPLMIRYGLERSLPGR